MTKLLDKAFKEDAVVWFWIGAHAEYERSIRRFS